MFPNALFFALCLGRQRLAQVLKPRLLGAVVVGIGLHQVHKGHDGLFEAAVELFIDQVAVTVERLVSLGQREHVGIDSGPQMLQRHA